MGVVWVCEVGDEPGHQDRVVTVGTEGCPPERAKWSCFSSTSPPGDPLIEDHEGLLEHHRCISRAGQLPRGGLAVWHHRQDCAPGGRAARGRRPLEAAAATADDPEHRPGAVSPGQEGEGHKAPVRSLEAYALEAIR
jgi:hypothetical protein